MKIIGIGTEILICIALWKILNEIRRTKCAINRFNRIRKHFLYGTTSYDHLNKKPLNQGAELFPIGDIPNGYGHIFTRDEGEKMTTTEFIKNEAAINEQLRKGLL